MLLKTALYVLLALLTLRALAYDEQPRGTKETEDHDFHRETSNRGDEAPSNSGILEGKFLSSTGIPVIKESPGSLKFKFATGEMEYPTPFVLHNLGLGHLADPKNSKCLKCSSNYKEIYSEGAHFKPPDQSS